MLCRPFRTFFLKLMKNQQTNSSHIRGGREGALKDWTAIVLLGCGIIMAFIALMLPPPGEIHDSVLYIFAQILIYCGSILTLSSSVATRQSIQELKEHLDAVRSLLHRFGIDSYINHKVKDHNVNNKSPNDYD